MDEVEDVDENNENDDNQVIVGFLTLILKFKFCEDINQVCLGQLLANISLIST